MKGSGLGQQGAVIEFIPIAPQSADHPRVRTVTRGTTPNRCLLCGRFVTRGRLYCSKCSSAGTDAGPRVDESASRERPGANTARLVGPGAAPWREDHVMPRPTQLHPEAADSRSEELPSGPPATQRPSLRPERAADPRVTGRWIVMQLALLLASVVAGVAVAIGLYLFGS